MRNLLDSLNEYKKLNERQEQEMNRLFEWNEWLEKERLKWYKRWQISYGFLQASVLLNIVLIIWLLVHVVK